MVTMPAIGVDQSPTLLERRHEQLRLEVEHAALGLFAQHGYSAVTVDDIAAATGISPRTFFRHFPTKEEVLVGELRRRIDRVAACIATRPASEAPVATLRHAILSEVKGDNRDASGDWARIISSDPALFARVSGIAAAQRSVITELLAARMGVDPAKDVRPGVIAASMLAAAEQVLRVWLQGTGDESLPAATDQALSFVERGLRDDGPV